jgi:hypothetical protein
MRKKYFWKTFNFIEQKKHTKFKQNEKFKWYD